MQLFNLLATFCGTHKHSHKHILPRLAVQIFGDHFIQDFPVEGMSEKKMFRTRGGEKVELTFNENGEVTMAKPADSPPKFSGIGNVVGMYNTSAPGNATVYFVDSKLSDEDVAVSTLL
eukprot:scaffold116730_cov16-Tisochrysis_lutea.AAC.1